MSYKQACNIFRDVDNQFNGKSINVEQFNTNSGLYAQYCPVKQGSKRCVTDYEKLNAISGHAFMELTKNNKINLYSGHDPSIDFLVMGWCHRLYKISKDYKLPLKNSLEEYLGKSIGSFNYRGILFSKKHLMDSNISIMNMFYILFQHICETINIFETPNAQPHEYIKKGFECHAIYDNLSKFANQCGPYLKLLNHLKTIYNAFIKAAIQKNSHDKAICDQLKEFPSIEIKNLGSEFKSTKCKKLHQKLEKNVSMLKDESQEEHDEFSTLMGLLVSDDNDPDGDENNDGNNDLGNTKNPKKDLSKQLKYLEQHPPNSNQGISHDNSSKQDDKPEGKNTATENNNKGAVNTNSELERHEKDLKNTKVDLTDENDKPTNLKGEKEGIQDRANTGENDIKDPIVDTDDQKQNSNIQQEGSRDEHDDSEKTENTLNSLYNIKNALGMPGTLFMEIATNKVNNLYYTTLTNLENAYDKFSASTKTIIDQVSEQYQKHSTPTKETIPPPYNKESEPQIPPSSSRDQSLDQSRDQSPDQSRDQSADQPADNPTYQPSDQSADNPTNKNVESIKSNSLMITPMNEPNIHLDRKEESIQKVILPGNIFKGGIPTYVKAIVISIPIILLIMYKYLSYWRTKKSKGKTKMKKVINLVGVDKTKKTAIN
ncbi:CIR protein [Plasmodium chabaudi adami]|uniref:CIR protein n=1 Tax=Plasmodium chabaudi adami TaxID=5826 RepID=A0A1D3L9C2_PLACE|nr:CIR protein [Plasmodium chabaudi adami]